MPKTYIEQEVFLLGTRKIKSKAGKDCFMVDYAKEGRPKTDFINFDEYMAINSKNKAMQKVVGLFNVNLYDKIYLCDVK